MSGISYGTDKMSDVNVLERTDKASSKGDENHDYH